MVSRWDIKGTKEYLKQYKKDNKERIDELDKKWRDANPDKIKGYRKKYKDKNRDILNAKERERYHNNIERQREKGRLYAKNNPEKSNERQKRWNRNNPETAMFKRAKQRARLKNIEFTITLEDIIIPIECPVFGIPLSISIGRMSDNSPALDRIDPNKGYIKGNVMVISNRANQIKGFGTSDEHMKIAMFMKQSCNYDTEFGPVEFMKTYDYN
jgi:hypothetical protein